jgi:hypothetical protein
LIEDTANPMKEGSRGKKYPQGLKESVPTENRNKYSPVHHPNIVEENHDDSEDQCVNGRQKNLRIVFQKFIHEMAKPNWTNQQEKTENNKIDAKGTTQKNGWIHTYLFFCGMDTAISSQKIS